MFRELKRRLFVATLALACLGLAVPSAAAGSKSFGDRLSEWLNEPGVRAVVVEFYSDYCEPCKDAAPAWERLRKRYEKAGLRLVVINIDDVENVGQCKKLPWTPWKALCKPELAKELGISKVPQSFIWSWQGNLLMSGKKDHVREAEAVIKTYFQDNPRIVVEAKDARGRDIKRVQRLIESELSVFDKMSLVASEKDRKNLRAHQERTFRPEAREDQQCALGGEISANMVLTAELFPGSVSLTLKQLGSTCLQSVSSSYKRTKEAASIKTAVFRLMSKLRRKVQIPGGERIASPVRAPSQPTRPSFSAGKVTAAKGRLRIEGAPRGARVDVSGPGGWRGEGILPTTLENLDPGPYTVKASAVGYVDGSTQATVRPDETTVARITLDLPAALDVTGSPPGAKVELFTASGTRLTEGSFPLRGSGLTPGLIRLRVSREGYTPHDERHTLKAGETATLKIELKRQSFTSDPSLPPHLKIKERACKTGQFVACHALAKAYRKGEWVPKSLARAEAIYTYACALKFTTACGRAYEYGLGVPKDQRKAAQLYDQACRKREAPACTSLGYLYDHGLGVSKDQVRAASLFKKGCDGGHARGCTNLGVLYDNGRGVSKDEVRAASLYKKGCDGGYALGCTGLGISYANGRGVSKDEVRAASLYKKGCDGGNAIGCSNLGVLYAKGLGVSKDEVRAASLYKKACKLGYKKACSW